MVRRTGTLLARLSEKADKVETDQRFAREISCLVRSGSLQRSPFANGQPDHVPVVFNSGCHMANTDLLENPPEPLMNWRTRRWPCRAAVGAVRPKSITRRLNANPPNRA